jgi:hypothetical protein
MMTRDCISLFERRGSPPRHSEAIPKPSTVSVPSIASTSKIVRNTVIRSIWAACRIAASPYLGRGIRILVPTGDQTAGDDLGLDLGGTLENIEDARVA